MYQKISFPYIVLIHNPIFLFIFYLLLFLLTNKNITLFLWSILVLLIIAEKTILFILFLVARTNTVPIVNTYKRNFLIMRCSFLKCLRLVNIFLLYLSFFSIFSPVDCCVREGDRFTFLILPVYFQHDTTIVEKTLEMRGLKKNYNYIIYNRWGLIEDVKYSFVLIYCNYSDNVRSTLGNFLKREFFHRGVFLSFFLSHGVRIPYLFPFFFLVLSRIVGLFGAFPYFRRSNVTRRHMLLARFRIPIQNLALFMPIVLRISSPIRFFCAPKMCSIRCACPRTLN
jgi:hypothetical protein